MVDAFTLDAFEEALEVGSIAGLVLIRRDSNGDRDRLFIKMKMNLTKTIKQKREQKQITQSNKIK